MDIKEFSAPDELERNSFFWSEARLVIGALALLLGGVPPALMLVRAMPGLYGLVFMLLKLAWIVSGVASAYLLYRWNANKQMVFGGKAQLDTAAFFVSVVSGLNLGITGLLGTNIGMTISSSRPIFTLVGILYLAAAGYLYKRWNESSHKIF